MQLMIHCCYSLLGKGGRKGRDDGEILSESGGESGGEGGARRERPEKSERKSRRKERSERKPKEKKGKSRFCLTNFFSVV